MAKILYVDDSKIIGPMIKEFLENNGHQVTMAENSLGALEILNRGEKFDVILSDNRMPGMDGKMQDNAGRELLAHPLTIAISKRILVSTMIGEISYNERGSYWEFSKEKLADLIEIISGGKDTAPGKPPSSPSR